MLEKLKSGRRVRNKLGSARMVLAEGDGPGGCEVEGREGCTWRTAEGQPREDRR